MSMTKYKNQKVTIDGERFDSVREATRWWDLRLLQRAGEISDLQRQAKFLLIPAQKDASGKCIEKAVSYIADFVYKDHGALVVEDAKGVRTKEYIIKRKLMLYMYDIRIQEV